MIHGIKVSISFILFDNIPSKLFFKIMEATVAYPIIFVLRTISNAKVCFMFAEFIPTKRTVIVIV